MEKDYTMNNNTTTNTEMPDTLSMDEMKQYEAIEKQKVKNSMVTQANPAEMTDVQKQGLSAQFYAPTDINGKVYHGKDLTPEKQLNELKKVADPDTTPLDTHEQEKKDYVETINKSMYQILAEAEAKNPTTPEKQQINNKRNDLLNDADKYGVWTVAPEPTLWDNTKSFFSNAYNDIVGNTDAIKSDNAYKALHPEISKKMQAIHIRERIAKYEEHKKGQWDWFKALKEGETQILEIPHGVASLVGINLTGLSTYLQSEEKLNEFSEERNKDWKKAWFPVRKTAQILGFELPEKGMEFTHPDYLALNVIEMLPSIVVADAIGLGAVKSVSMLNKATKLGSLMNVFPNASKVATMALTSGAVEAIQNTGSAVSQAKRMGASDEELFSVAHNVFWRDTVNNTMMNLVSMGSGSLMKKDLIKNKYLKTAVVGTDVLLEGEQESRSNHLQDYAVKKAIGDYTAKLPPMYQGLFLQDLINPETRSQAILAGLIGAKDPAIGFLLTTADKKGHDIVNNMQIKKLKNKTMSDIKIKIEEKNEALNEINKEIEEIETNNKKLYQEAGKDLPEPLLKKKLERSSLENDITALNEELKFAEKAVETNNALDYKLGKTTTDAKRIQGQQTLDTIKGITQDATVGADAKARIEALDNALEKASPEEINDLVNDLRTNKDLKDYLQLTNDDIDALRQDLGLKNITKGEVVTFQSLLDNAKKKGIKQQAYDIAHRIINAPQSEASLTQTERVGLMVKAGELRNEFNEKMSKSRELRKNGNEIEGKSLKNQALQVKSQLDTITSALKKGQSFAGGLLNSIKMKLNPDELTLYEAINIAESKSKKPLNEKFVQGIEDIYGEIEALNKQIEEMSKDVEAQQNTKVVENEKSVSLDADEILNNTEKIEPDAKFDEVNQKIQELKNKASNLAELSPESKGVVGDLAQLLIAEVEKQGGKIVKYSITGAKESVNDIAEAITEHRKKYRNSRHFEIRAAQKPDSKTPAKAKARIMSDGEKSIITLYTDNISKKEVDGLLLHEGMVHGLLYQLLNEKEINNLLGNVSELLSAEENAKIENIYNNIYKDYQHKDKLINEEKLGYFMETRNIDNIIKSTPIRDFVRKIIKFMKDTFGISYNEKDLTATIKKAVKNYRSNYKIDVPNIPKEKILSDSLKTSNKSMGYDSAREIVFPKYSAINESSKQNLINKGYLETRVNNYIKQLNDETVLKANKKLPDNYIEFSTMPKRFTSLTSTVTEIQKRLNRSLTADEIRTIITQAQKNAENNTASFINIKGSKFEVIDDLSGVIDKDNEVLLQSWTDFTQQHNIDLMRTVASLENAKIKAYANTNQIEFAKALSNTGIKVNLFVNDSNSKEAMQLSNENKNINLITDGNAIVEPKTVKAKLNEEFTKEFLSKNAENIIQEDSLHNVVEDTINQINNSTPDDIKYSVSKEEFIPKNYTDLQTYIANAVSENPNVTIDDIVGMVKKMMPQLNNKQIYDAISNRKPLEKKKQLSELEKKVKDLKKQALYLSKIDDAINGIFEPYQRKETPTLETQALQDQLLELKNAYAKNNIDPQQVDYYSDRIKELNKRLTTIQETQKDPLLQRPKREYNAIINALKQQAGEITTQITLEKNYIDAMNALKNNDFEAMKNIALTKEQNKVNNEQLTNRRKEYKDILTQIKNKVNEKIADPLKKKHYDNLIKQLEQEYIDYKKTGKMPEKRIKLIQNAEIKEKIKAVNDLKKLLNTEEKINKINNLIKTKNISELTKLFYKEKTKKQETQNKVYKEKQLELNLLLENVKQLVNYTIPDPQKVNLYQDKIQKIQSLIEESIYYQTNPEKPKRLPENALIAELKKQYKDLQSLLATKAKLAKVNQILENNNYDEMSKYVEPKPRKVTDSEELKNARIELHHQRRKLINKVNDAEMLNTTMLFLKIGATLRTLKLSGDTALFRQGQYSFAKDPIGTSKAMKENLAYFTDALFDPDSKIFKLGEKAEKRFSKMMYELKQSPHWYEYMETGLSITDPSMGILKSEEAFLFTNWAEKKPVLNRMIQGSELGYTAFLNMIRVNWYESLRHESMTTEEKKYIAEFVNAATGRAKLPGKLEASARGLTSILLAPRWYMSQIEMMGGILFTEKYKNSKTVRQEYHKTMRNYIAQRIAFLAMCTAGGGKVEWKDFDSPFWMKVQFGDNVVDPFGGQQWVLKFLLSGAVGSTAFVTGEKNKLKNTTWDLLKKNLGYKLNPLLALYLTSSSGEDAMGRKTTLGKEIQKMPFSLLEETVIDAVKNDNVADLPLLMTFDFFAMGSYHKTKKKSYR